MRPEKDVAAQPAAAAAATTVKEIPRGTQLAVRRVSSTDRAQNDASTSSNVNIGLRSTETPAEDSQAAAKIVFHEVTSV